MIVLELSFTAGRYHATPWGRHVNEGAVEWPPSPWRILRALIATWHLKARAEISESIMHDLVEKLSQPPVFRLPPATTSHTRHYMPYNEGNNNKTKIFDTFVQVEKGSKLLVAWNRILSAEQMTALRMLAERLGYFGRAESVVEAHVLEGIAAIEANSFPLEDGMALPPKTELVRSLAPMSPDEYQNWRASFLNSQKAPTSEKKGSKSKKKGFEIPADLFDVLHADTGELQAAGWNLPPGAQFVNYARPENAFAADARLRPHRGKLLPTVARFALISTVPPIMAQAISIADRVHASLCKWSDFGKGPAVVFKGLGADGIPGTDHHHAHIFCEAQGPLDAINHVTVWAPMGFDENACLALRRLNTVWGHGGHDIRLVLHGIGQAGDFGGCVLFGQSRVWRSLTPFVSTRHAKTYRDGRPKMDASGWQVGSGAHDLLRFLAMHPQGTGATVKQLDERERPYQFGNRRLRSIQFQTMRHNGEGQRGNSHGNAFEIVFTEPVSGPLAFGYGCHFGLGLFVPIKD